MTTTNCPACDEALKPQTKVCACGWRNPLFINNPEITPPIPMTKQELDDALTRVYGKGPDLAHEVQKIRAGLRPKSEWPSSSLRAEKVGR